MDLGPNMNLDMNLDMNSMPQHDPSSAAHDLDLQLQMAADEISTWTDQLPNLDLSVCSFITVAVLTSQSNPRR
jgi:hypothetical protein